MGSLASQKENYAHTVVEVLKIELSNEWVRSFVTAKSVEAKCITTPEDKEEGNRIKGPD